MMNMGAPALPPMAPPPPQPVPPDVLFQAQETLKKPTWDDVIKVLRNDRLRTFVIDIETDSTINADENAEKQAVSEFFSNVGSFLTSMMPIVQAAPEFGPLAMEMLKFGSRRFEAGRQMETVIDETADALLQRLSDPQSTQPDPKVLAAQAQAQAAVMKGQAQIAVEDKKVNAMIALKGQEAQANMALRQSQAESDAALEASKAQASAAVAAIKAASEPVKPIG